MVTWAARQTPAESKAKYAARDVCLDQDAAGRLLESMGDHARREMIVRTMQMARQNPAYRPIANNMTTSDGTLSEVVCFHQQPADRKKVDTLRGKTSWVFLACLLAGCSSARTSPPPFPLPTLPPAPVVVSPSAGPWSFSYAPGMMHYQVLRSAAIEGQSDSSTTKREISTNITHEIISLIPTADSGIVLTAAVDSFSTTTQGLIGPVQPVQLPVQVTGVFNGDTLVISSDSSMSSSPKCNPVSSALVADLHNLLTRFPTQLSQGLVWQDSVNTRGCQAAIPTNSRTIRSYVVSGAGIYEGRPVLLIQRSDTVQADGEGAQQQHPLKLNATGTGNAVYYLDPKDGRVIRLTTGQELSLTITTTSAKVHQFKQSSRQDFRLVP